jgi:hypothetical protein
MIGVAFALIVIGLIILFIVRGLGSSSVSRG